MPAFHAILHPAPPEPGKGPVVTLEGRQYSTLAITSRDLPAGLGCSFEAVEQHLHSLARLFIEPDGSFVWRGADAGSDWQLDGQLYDNAGQLTHVELKGHAPRQQLDQLFRCLGWPRRPLVFQLPRLSVFLDEHEFRRYTGEEKKRGERREEREDLTGRDC